MEILKGAMVVAVVYRKLMRKRPVVFANAVRHAQIDREPVGDTEVDFLNHVKQSNMAIVVARAIAIKVIAREEVLIAECYLTLAPSRYPGLADRRTLGQK